MRLRYLHLPRCGPLADTAIIFGREDRITKFLSPSRKGGLNFLVGVNGSGKSSLLRALYQIFQSLKHRERPALPVTLAWDRTLSGETKTTILHYTNQKGSDSFVATTDRVPLNYRRVDWEKLVVAMGKGEQHPLFQPKEVLTGSEAITSSMLLAYLPKRLIAYTSGTEDLWLQLDQPTFHPTDYYEEEYQVEDERPHGWSIYREWEEEKPLRISDVLTSHSLETSGSTLTSSVSGAFEKLPQEVMVKLGQELGPLENIRNKVLTNQMLRKKERDDFYFSIQAQHMRFAGITLGLWQAAKELAGKNEEQEREALRSNILKQNGPEEKPMDARRVLNKIDWYWPTHLSLTYRDSEDRVSPRQHQELLCLVGLAEEVVAQPRGRQRAVISLAPADQINLTEKLSDIFPYVIPSEIKLIADRVDGCKTGAEAVLRVFSADEEIDSTPMDVFSRFRDWERTGLLEDVTVTVKRLNRLESDDGEPEDSIITYDQLSDGEQMLLGRMGLLFLLRGQDGSLLLLDEPETHFNDVWKREIVEMVDMSLLNNTDANVIVATHTSIALTDAFAAEVTVLDKTEDGITARAVSGGLLGTDPGEVTMNLFRADSSIGRRSVDLLNQLLKTEWKGREEELEDILEILGSSFHRAELRAILKKLKADDDAPPSS